MIQQLFFIVITFSLTQRTSLWQSCSGYDWLFSISEAGVFAFTFSTTVTSFSEDVLNKQGPLNVRPGWLWAESDRQPVVNYLMNLEKNLPAVETDSALRSSWIPEEAYKLSFYATVKHKTEVRANVGAWVEIIFLKNSFFCEWKVEGKKEGSGLCQCCVVSELPGEPSQCS